MLKAPLPQGYGRKKGCTISREGLYYTFPAVDAIETRYDEQC